MKSGDFSDIPNPFAFASQTSDRPRRRALMAALKFFVLVAVCSALVLGISVGGKQYLMHRLTADFDSIGSVKQQERLAQIAQLGFASIGMLTETLLHDDIDVARTAYNLLGELQNDWTALNLSEQRTCHAELVDSIRGIAIRLPDDRTGWASTLLQQTISEFVQRTDSPTRELYRDANKAMEMLTLSTRSGPSIVADEPLDPLKPRRLIVRSEPLPIATFDTPELQSDSDQDRSPSIYRSTSSRLQAVEPEEPIVLHDVHSRARPAQESQETSYQVNQVQSTSTLVNSAMEAYDDPSVMTWLSSEHANLREQARLELMSRGYDERELSLADRISNSDLATRLELVDRIAREPSIDPRPWLWMMSHDEHREVRMKVVSIVATMNDTGAQRHLQNLLAAESDPVVAARIRRILK